MSFIDPKDVPVPEFYRWVRQTIPGEASGAVFSSGAPWKYRYKLWRTWDESLGHVKFIMLNPSTADALTDDPTIRKCVKFAKTWGYGGIRVVNLFAYRSTDPKALKKLSYSEAVGPDNNHFITMELSKPGLNIAAWGQHGKTWGRSAAVRRVLDQQKIQLHALKLSKDGTPYHPLYLRDDTAPFELR